MDKAGFGVLLHPEDDQLHIPCKVVFSGWQSIRYAECEQLPPPPPFPHCHKRFSSERCDFHFFEAFYLFISMLHFSCRYLGKTLRAGCGDFKNGVEIPTSPPVRPFQGNSKIMKSCIVQRRSVVYLFFAVSYFLL